MKPSLEEVLEYAKSNIRKFIAQFAADLPGEQKEEIESSANLRLIEAYPRLEPDLGWKSFVCTHCRGAVLDYLKFGRGFAETNWRLALGTDENGEKRPYKEKLRERVELVNSDSEHDLELIAGLNGIFTELDEQPVVIKWDLLARLARTDDQLHAFALWLRGYNITEMSPVFGLCRARVGQMIREFTDRFDEPRWKSDPTFRQTIYALGLCRHVGIPDVDQSELFCVLIGWRDQPVDLDSLAPKRQFKHRGGVARQKLKEVG